MNQLIIWNLVNKGKELNIYHVFPILTVPLVPNTWGEVSFYKSTPVNK